MSDYKEIWNEEYQRAIDEGWNEDQAASKADESMASQYADDCDHAYDEMKDRRLENGE